MNMQSMNELLTLVNGLSEKEQKEIVDKIMGMLSSPAESSKSLSCNEMVSENFGERPNCPHCKAEANLGFIVKRGYKRGVQRYFCKKCGHFFVATTNTAFSHSRKSADDWRKFIMLTISGASLATCAEECKIAYQTAFTWRHKILNVFRTNQNSTQMTGVVEMDEMFIPLNYKGNHIKGFVGDSRIRRPGMDNGLPRASYKRGTDNKPKSPKQRACVFCMVEDGNKSFYAAVPGVGAMQNDMLDATFAKHVNKEEAFVLVDDYKVTKNYLETNSYNHLSLLSNTSDNVHAHKPQIEGEFHLQHVNAMHHHIRRFLKDYCGVSSKYLINYISMYVWLRNVNTNRKNQLQKISISRASFSDCYISNRTIKAYPSIPTCA